MSGVAQQVLFELCNLDVAVRTSEVWTQAAQFLAPFLMAGYKRMGKPIAFSFFTSEQLSKQIALDWLLEAAH